MAAPAPVAAGDRLESLDVLRGFALLGILAMNIRAMGAPFGAYMYPYALYDGDLSHAAFRFTTIVFDLKMMGLFSMLFGAGVLLYAAKPTARGRAPTGLWFRRMFWLLVIGLVHSYLIWDGDILVPYAMCGLLFLWWVRRLPGLVLVLGAIAFLSIGALLNLSFGAWWDQMPADERAENLKMWTPTREQALAQLQHLRGSYLDIVAHRAPGVVVIQTFVFCFFFLWRAGGMMLLGMGLAKLGLLTPRHAVRVYAVLAAVCIPLGLFLAWQGVQAQEAVAYRMPHRTTADLWNYTGSVLASIGYAAFFVLLVKLNLLGWLRRHLAAVGQMAFTNYLMQSILTAVFFLGWGFNYAGELDYAQQLIVVAAIWALELAWSPWWLARFNFGPAEWLWRSLTYWKLQPMRRAPAAAPLAAA